MARSQLERQAQRETKSNDFSGRLVTIVNPASVVSEAFRTLRTSLLYATVTGDEMPPKVLVLASHGSVEGKSTVCANLGVVLAQAGKRTLILDCDFRRPVMHKIFDLRNFHGIVEILARQYSLQEVCQEPLPGLSLKVLTVGAVPPNPAELLSSRRFSEFLANTREEFDYVLIDSSPIGLVSDPIMLATQGDGVLITFDAQKTRKGDIRRVVRNLKAVGANVLGTVMNNAKESRDSYYYSYN